MNRQLVFNVSIQLLLTFIFAVLSPGTMHIKGQSAFPQGEGNEETHKKVNDCNKTW